MQTRLIRSELLHLHGRDALAFVHSQTMNDSNALTDGQWQWSGWLTPKGRLVAFFALYRQGGDSVILWLPAGGADALRDRLQRFVFRSKVTLEPRPDWQALGCFPDAAESAAPATTIARLDLGNAPDAPHRELLIVEGNDAEVDESALAYWRLADLHAGVPYIAAGADNSEQFVPQWLSLDRLDAFSIKKGCYPGQEIVARMHFLGQSKRAAFRLLGEGEPPAGMAKVTAADGRSLGEVVWATASDGRWQALAVLNTEQVAGHVHIQHADGSETPATLA